jgi:hypothetical protein
MKCDVFVSTRNVDVGLASAKRNVEVGRVPVNTLNVNKCSLLSYCRYQTFQKSTTEWTVIFDDDVEIEEGWFDQLSRYIAPDVIAVEGLIGYTGPARLLKKGERSYGGWNTLFRTDVYKKWKPDKWVRALDDYLLGQFGIKYGKWVRVPVQGKHTMNLERSAFRGGIGYREVLGAKCIIQMGKLAVMIPVYSFKKNRYGMTQNTLAIKGIMSRPPNRNSSEKAAPAQSPRIRS